METDASLDDVGVAGVELGGVMRRGDGWSEPATRSCPWCGRTCWGWAGAGVFECGLCGVQWGKDGMKTRRQDKPDYVNEVWDKIDVAWKDVPDGCLVVRGPG